MRCETAAICCTNRDYGLVGEGGEQPRITLSVNGRGVGWRTMHYDSLVPREWFGKASMQRINVLSIQRISAEDRAKIEAVDPAIELIDAGGWYDGEIRETWPAFTTARTWHQAPRARGPARNAIASSPELK